MAVDARTGDLRWRYRRRLPDGLQQLHPTSRGVGLWDDKVYMATGLDAVSWSPSTPSRATSSGSRRWEDYRTGYYMTMAPLVVDGKVMVGVSGGELGIRGFVTALDAETGAEVWKTYTIPGPGEPGNDSWPGDSWQTGGAPVWVTGTFDPDLNLTYWGTGNPGPWVGDARPGDNLYTNSVIALDADTGELKGHHQYHWNGSWDWDEVDAPLLIDVTRNGRTTKSLVHPGRNGYLWILGREQNAITFLDAEPYVYQDVFRRLDPGTGRPEYDPERRPGTGRRVQFCPSLWGGKDWPPASFSPQTRLLYIPANENLCSYLEGRDVEYEPGRAFTGASSQTFVPGGAPTMWGELQAWNLDTGEKVWTTEFDSQNWGPVLTTGGGLVFMGGTNDRPVSARFGRHHRRDPVGAADKLRHHGGTFLLLGGRRAIHRRPVRVGGRCPAHAGCHQQQRPGSSQTGATGRRRLGLRTARERGSSRKRPDGFASFLFARAIGGHTKRAPAGRPGLFSDFRRLTSP